MNKKSVIILAAIIVLAVGGGALAYAALRDNSDETNSMAMQDDAMMKDDSKTTDTMAKDDAMMKDDAAMAKQGSYITLADYSKDPAAYTDDTKVYYFHASWCPSCKAIDEEINADAAKIPAGVVLIQTDFDTETKLRQKYGVTYQHTFVQVDNNGNKIAKWSATNLDDVVAGIQES